MENNEAVNAEDPSKVQGAPGGEAPPAAAAVQAKAPLHKGFDREITTPEDLVKYTKDLESLLVSKPQTPVIPAVNTPQAFASNAPPATGKSETFEDLVYSDPGKAKSVLLEEFRAEQRRESEIQKAQGVFWNEFYQKNADLKDLQHVVQSVFERDRGAIGGLKTNQQVAEHVAAQARQIVDLVKGKVGVTETRVESKPAMTFSGGIGGQGSNAPAPQKPQSFAEQIARFRKRAK